MVHVSQSSTVENAHKRAAERFLMNQLFIFLDKQDQNYLVRHCARNNVPPFELHHDLDNALITNRRAIASYSEDCLAIFLEDLPISDIYKHFLMALRDSNVPVLRSLLNNNLNNYLREVLLSFALCYALAKNHEAVAHMLLEYPISSEMLLAPLKIAMQQENSALCVMILSQLEVPKEFFEGVENMKTRQTNYITTYFLT